MDSKQRVKFGKSEFHSEKSYIHLLTSDAINFKFLRYCDTSNFVYDMNT